MYCLAFRAGVRDGFLPRCQVSGYGLGFGLVELISMLHLIGAKVNHGGRHFHAWDDKIRITFNKVQNTAFVEFGGNLNST